MTVIPIGIGRTVRVRASGIFGEGGEPQRLEVALVIGYLQDCGLKPTKIAAVKSYELMLLAEKYWNHSISEGAVIIAAHMLGLRVERIGHTSSARIAISKKVLK